LGNLPESIEAFKKAITIDPRFVEAEINLAMQYSKSRQAEPAIAHAQRAFEMRSGDPDAARTLAMILLDAKQYVQIERVARLMLIKQQAVSEMHGMLAISLIGQRRNLDEAFSHLELAAKDFPIARWLVANALIEAGLPKLASVQINTYLNSSTNECERESLQSWVDSIDQSRSTIAAVP
jgi:tetratricopeptide (TPR) repeat protein